MTVDEAAEAHIRLIKEQSSWPDGYIPKDTILKSGDTFQMALDSSQPVTSPGRFATTNNISSVDFVRNNLAVKSDWKADCSKVIEYRVKGGVEIPVQIGPVGAQIDINIDKYLPGGANQIFINLGRGVNMMDYLEVVSIRYIK